MQKTVTSESVPPSRIKSKLFVYQTTILYCTYFRMQDYAISFKNYVFVVIVIEMLIFLQFPVI